MHRRAVPIILFGGASDTTAPTCVITASASIVTAGAFTATFTFSEAVTGFEIGDITLSANAGASNFATADNIVFTATITPTTTGTVTVDVGAGVCTDGAGNANTAATQFSILGLVAALWLKASVGLYQDAGTTPATADGHLVQQWNDQSGNGRNASNGGGTQRPALKLNIINNLPVVRFDGSSDLLSTASAVQLPITLFVVTASNTLTPPTTSIIFEGSVNLTPALYIENVSSTWRWVAAHAGVGTYLNSAATIIDTSWHIHRVLFTDSGSHAIDNSVKNSGDLNNNNTPAVFKIGARTVGSAYYNGDIAELIVCSGALAAGPIAAVESYLDTKYLP